MESDRTSISSKSYSDDGNHELINPLSIPTNLDLPRLNYPTSDTPVVLRYVSDILLQEDNPCMLYDCLDLKAAEKSFYDVLHQNESTTPADQSCQESFFCNVLYSPVLSSQPDTSLVSVSLSKLQSLAGNSGIVEEDNNWHEKFKNLKGQQAKKDRQRQDDHCLEEYWRSNKQSVQSVANSADDSEEQEMFDQTMLFQNLNLKSTDSSSHHESSNEGSRHSKGSNKVVRSKRQSKEEKLVDLRTMLIQCAQAVGSYDQRNTSELLNQIRQHSSPYGDANQRLAHYFAEGLQVRLAGTKAPPHSFTLGPQISSIEILKHLRTYITATPIKTLPQFFANMAIMKLAEKATSLHIIDFGISYGFQWPFLIQWLSERHGGPPKLRITGIELPQPGFRPTERVEETGRHLAKFSARFGVPFEFHAIAQRWETIEFDDLKIDRNKMIVVNCLQRVRHVPELTMMGNSPRDDVLKLIRKINPEIFLHGVINGAHNSSFFLTRFKQALFHFNACFDIVEATMSCEDEERRFYERTGAGREIMNLVASEGLEIVERPETYQKWQARNVRAGLKQLPLDRVLLEKVKTVSKSIGYHKDFSIHEDEKWMLQGWRGRVLAALSFWKGE